MNKVIVTVLVSVILISLGLLIYASNSWNKDQRIDEVRVIGNDILNENEIVNLTDSLCFKSSFSTQDFLEIKERILTNSYIKNADIYTNSNKLIIEIDERAPVAYYISKGEVFLLSADMTTLPMRDDISDYNLPVLRIKNGAINKSNEILIDIFKLIVNNNNLNLLLSEIIFNKQTGEFDLVLNQNSILVKVGRKELLAEKFKKFNEFWFKVALKEGINFKIIDLRWDKKILVS
ncbi:cell division protein FtsQ/DivIB [Candidatus Kapabacteria bacterium]|nr:cell division protein FtsQ/DivIB [Candidatus Kapabacteria bacterium]